MRVRSAPLRPGASPINITRASIGPFRSLRTAVRSHIAGQRIQAAASETNAWNFLRFSFIEFDLSQTAIDLKRSFRLERALLFQALSISASQGRSSQLCIGTQIPSRYFKRMPSQVYLSGRQIRRERHEGRPSHMDAGDQTSAGKPNRQRHGSNTRGDENATKASRQEAF